jgi:hypothetical protein
VKYNASLLSAFNVINEDMVGARYTRRGFCKQIFKMNVYIYNAFLPSAFNVINEDIVGTRYSRHGFCRQIL